LATASHQKTLARAHEVCEEMSPSGVVDLRTDRDGDVAIGAARTGLLCRPTVATTPRIKAVAVAEVE
jgi:hypothetical protein